MSGPTPSFTDIATAASAAIAAVVFFFNRREASKRERFETASQQAATIKVFNQRYQDLMVYLRSLEEKDPPASDNEIAAYYASYWSIQIDCWEYFKLGVLPPITYATWLLYVFDLVRAGIDRESGSDSGEFDERWTQEHWQSVGLRMARNNVEYRLLLEQIIALAKKTVPASADVKLSTQDRYKLRKRLLSLANEAVRRPARNQENLRRGVRQGTPDTPVGLPSTEQR